MTSLVSDLRIVNVCCAHRLRLTYCYLFVLFYNIASTASVVFDFDACDFTTRIITSIQAFTFADELNAIVDNAIDPVIAKAPFLPASFAYNVKSTIVSQASTKVNQVKAAVITRLNTLNGSCSRRLSETEVQQDGSQRMLQTGRKFSDLAGSIQTINGVVSPFAHHILSKHDFAHAFFIL